MDQECRITMDGPEGLLYVEELIDLRPNATREVIDLSHSPLWRLDFRTSEMLEQTDPQITSAEWLLVPSLDSWRNGGTTLAKVGGSRAGQIDVQVVHAQKAVLSWTGLRLGDYYQVLPRLDSHTPWGRLDPIAQNTTFDVRVTLEFPNATGGLETSLEVLVFKPTNQIDDRGVVLLSAVFPEVVVPNIGGSAEDDVLLTPFQHGFLFANPLESFSLPAIGDAWKDSFLYDFGRYIAQGTHVSLPGGTSTTQGRHMLYPGEMSSQFLFLYDLQSQDDHQPLMEPFFHYGVDGYTIDGLGKRPSQRGGGQGLYVSVTDPDLNLKAIVNEACKGAGGLPLLRLGMRTLVEFQAAETGNGLVSRFSELQLANRSGQTELWQSFGIGTTPPTPPLAEVEDLHFSTWHGSLNTMVGDWYDAAQEYRNFFLEESSAIARDASGQAIPLQELPNSILPQEFREDLVGVALLEPPSTPIGRPYNGTPRVSHYRLAVGEQAATIRAFVDFLREDHQQFLPDEPVPYVSVIHGEGMINPVGPNPVVVKSSGVENLNHDVRTGLPNLYNALRTADDSWPGRVLTYINRDTGNYYTGRPYPGVPDLPLVARASGADAPRRSGRVFNSYAREGGPAHLLGRLRDVYARFGPSGVGTLDWHATSGQMSVAKPDYAALKEAGRGLGGGNVWAQNLARFRETLQSEHQNWPGATNSVAFTSTERFHEGVLQNNYPVGHRQFFPASAVEYDGTPLLPIMMGEPLGLTSVLYHDYTLMQSQPISFSRFYALPLDENPNEANSSLLDQDTEQSAGQHFSLYRLAQITLDLGLHPGLGLNVDPFNALERDWHRNGIFDAAYDYLCEGFGGEATAGLLDTIDPTLGRPPLGLPDAARRILRGRMKLRDFLVGGQRIRDPQLAPLAQIRHPFYADHLLMRRLDRLDDRDSKGTYSGPDLQLSNLVMGAWKHPLGVNLHTQEQQPEWCEVAIPIFNHADHPVEYTLDLPLSSWELSGPRILRCFVIADGEWKAHPSLPPLKFEDGQESLRLDHALLGEDATIDGYGLQVWLVLREAP